MTFFFLSDGLDDVMVLWYGRLITLCTLLVNIYHMTPHHSYHSYHSILI
jgi:hypothetical protein